jgi:hypothetical protein
LLMLLVLPVLLVLLMLPVLPVLRVLLMLPVPPCADAARRAGEV